MSTKTTKEKNKTHKTAPHFRILTGINVKGKQSSPVADAIFIACLEYLKILYVLFKNSNSKNKIMQILISQIMRNGRRTDGKKNTIVNKIAIILHFFIDKKIRIYK